MSEAVSFCCKVLWYMNSWLAFDLTNKRILFFKFKEIKELEFNRLNKNGLNYWIFRNAFGKELSRNGK